MQKTTSWFLAVATGVLLYVPTFAQLSVSGKIIDAQDGSPLPGATIRAGSFRGTIANSKGEFVFKDLPKEIELLEVSFIGYESNFIKVSNFDKVVALQPSTFHADEVVINATRATQKSAVAFTNVGKLELSKQNLGQDLPMLLNFTPSLVTTSDAGAGIGYTGMRIRGTDATRINVTINGIPYNDAESQGTFWVNMPDFSSSVSSVQIQRGVGTSTNGAAAFGATVNINTNEFRKEGYAEINNSFGSFKTRKHTVLAGTGLLKNKFTLDARLSKITSDGFIDRAKSDLGSFYVSGAYFGKKSMVRMNVFSGKEITYQAWEGIPEARLRGDREGILAYIDRNGLNERDAQNLLNAHSRTYNLYLYDNQVDNYQQDHYQLISSHNLSKNWAFNLNGFLVKGRGYYEQFRDNDKLKNYKLSDVVAGNQTISRSDLIRRRWLDNAFYGTTFSLDYNDFNKLTANIGGGWNQYDGNHFGEVIWARFASNGSIRHRYYENVGLKTDLNLYGKLYYQLSDKLNVFADAQFRQIGYFVKGDDNQRRQQLHDVNYSFFNPKGGLTYQVSENSTAFASFSLAHREPNRDDFTESTRQIQPQPEVLRDLEVGYRFQRGRLAASVGGYYMNYKNQLVVSGQLNDVGNPIKINVPQSYRAGIEIEIGAQLSKQWKWNANATFSQNKINNFTEYVIDYDDENGGYKTMNHGNSDIALSPNLIVGSQLLYTPTKKLELALLTKYVGKQYLDNTSNTSRQLNAYFTNDLRLIYHIKPQWMNEITVSVLANNVFNTLYESNGYTYSYIYGGQTTTENFYYPQTGRNFLVSVGLKF
ncbi:MAG: TonB-dependent receptor [Spirosomataceae bacterium]